MVKVTSSSTNIALGVASTNIALVASTSVAVSPFLSPSSLSLASRSKTNLLFPTLLMSEVTGIDRAWPLISRSFATQSVPSDISDEIETVGCLEYFASPCCSRMLNPSEGPRD